MKENLSDKAKSRPFIHDILFRTAAVLLFLTLLSTWLVCGMYAKYVRAYTFTDSARLAEGVGIIELKEHKIKETYKDSGIYELDTTEVNENEYEKVIPGVDIPKDPFIRITNLTETECELYVRVTEKNFPVKKGNEKTVTYELTADWTLMENLSDYSKGIYIYKYNKAIDLNFSGVINILKNNKIYVSEHYVGKDADNKIQNFSLTFETWLVQAKQK